MATQSKIIGRVPVSRQEYVQGATYYKDNIVMRYGSAFQCTVDSTTTPPATLDASGALVLGAGWIFFADASAAKTADNRLDRIDQTLGQYSARPSFTLSAKETGVAISRDGAKVSKAGWAIAEFTATKGNEYLFKPGAIDGSVCVFSEKVTRSEVRNIDYTYTYDSKGRISSATATYGGKTYTYSYSYTENEEGYVTSETITDNQTGKVINVLPYQYVAEVGTYLPMTVLNAAAELPQDGYCRLVSHFQSDTDLTVVVSYNVAQADLTVKVVRDGFTASICTQLSNLSKRIANTTDFIYVVESAQKATASEVTALIADLQEVPDFSEIRLCGQPVKLFGHGAPSAGSVPDNWIQMKDGGYDWNGVPSALGQEYINVDSSTGGHYIAIRDSAMKLKWYNC